MVLEYIGKNNIRMIHLLDFSKKTKILIVFFFIKWEKIMNFF